MKTQKRHLILLLALLLGNAGLALAQERTTTIYLDLAAGNVIINDSQYTGSLYENGTIHTYTGQSYTAGSTEFYIYQSQDTDPTKTASYCTNTGLVGGVYKPASYDEMGSPVIDKTWSEYITNNNNVEDVVTNWPIYAAAVGKTPATHRIYVSGNANFTITLDGIWSDYVGNGTSNVDQQPICIIGGNYVKSTTLKIKGDCRVRNLRYECTYKNKYKLYITSAAGDGEDDGSLTVANLATDEYGYDGMTIIGPDRADEYGLTFKGATVFAGFVKQLNSVWDERAHVKFTLCVGGGTRSVGEVTINGGTLTAVSNGTSPAIGGGGGYNAGSTNGLVTINGGSVYAYGNGVYSTEHSKMLPTVAIGGGGTFEGNARGGGSTSVGDKDPSEITITGGYVFAQSVGGPAIGGGTSLFRHQEDPPGTTAYASNGGVAIVTISGGEVEAYSVEGDFVNDDLGVNYHADPGVAIGGGNGNSDAGDVTLTISGASTRVTATAVSGGTATNTTNASFHAGNTTLTINGGKLDCKYIRGGDKAMATEANTLGTLTLSVGDAGTLKTGYVRGGHDGSSPNKYGKVEASISGNVQGQFVLYDNLLPTSAVNTFTMTGGTLDNTELGTSAYPRLEANGGAIYSDRATNVITMSGGTITHCSGTNGGAIYLGAGTFNMSGGTITGNTATSNGGGVYKLGSMHVSGSPVVKGNTVNGKTNNVYIHKDASEAYINIPSVSPLQCGAQIGVTKLEGEHTYTDLSESTKYTNITQGKSTSVYAPFYLEKITVKDGERCEFIIPAEALSEMNNKTITQMTFYHTDAESWGSPTFQFYLVERTSPTISSYRKAYTDYQVGDCSDPPGLVKVIETGGVTWNDLTITVPFSSATYKYNPTSASNHHLLVGHYLIAKATTTTCTFSGITAEGACVSDVKDETSPAQRNFIPKVTFTFADKSTWTFPDDYVLPALTAACDNHYFFDDTQLSKVCSSSYDASFDPYTLYFVKNAEGDESWLRQASSAAVATDYTLNAAGTHVESIKTAKGLAYFASEVLSGKDYAGQTVTLTNDINLSGHNWEPAGFCAACGDAGTTTFAGTFDGQGHRIYNLSSTYDYKNMGLFGHVTGTVKNVVINGTVTGSGATNLGGIAGELDGGTIYNCISTATLSGGTNTGALVGKVTSGSLLNSFAISNDLICGTGTATNCYVRKASGGTSSNMGTATNVGASANNTGAFTETETPYLYRHADNQRGSASLLSELNAWVDAQSTPTDLAHWTRTCASPINGDYPLLMMPGTICVGSNDNTELQYRSNLNTLMTDITDVAGHNIFLYNNADGVTADNVNRGIYIAEDAALIHTSVIDNAYVGVTLKNAAWHMFSPAISSAPLGINYNNDATVYNYGTAPAQYAFYPEATADGYFPSTDFGGGSYYGDYDYYSYYEPQYHWINFKRNSPSHWHEDIDHRNIEYHWDNNPDNATSEGNETTLKPGKGYLLGIKTDTYLQSHGTLNPSDGTSDVVFPVTKKSEWRTGYNLIGNPYQAYLDFDAFVVCNSGSGKIWNEASSAFYLRIYEGAYRSYVYGSSSNQLQAPRCLHPHQGFMVITENNTDAIFQNGMRELSDAVSAPFRGEAGIDYPLVNLIATDEDGKSDILTVELGRPEAGGAPKAYDLHTGKGCLYVNYEDKDYAIAFTQPGIDQVAVRFAADEEATFTMTWDMENGEFSYLHLIDNMTGTDIDCLAANEYRFTASPNDYKSRFRLVFDYTGIEEPEVSEPVEGPTTFAFQMNNELVVNGEGQLQMFDLTGRLVMSANTYGTQSSVALPEISKGMYVLRINGKNGIKTQKIVIK